MIRFYKRDFRAWLVEKQRVMVGLPSEIKKCPVCNFLRSRGAKTVEVQITHRRVDGQRHEHNKWQRDFQKKAMKLQRDLDVIGLRGRECLAILDELAGNSR